MTIAYIAESAGVSAPTVSKVLNGRSGVSDETRARVEQLIHQHGYRKPPKNRSNLVELVFRELESMWAVEIIRGVERVARRNRIGVLVSEFGLHDTSGMTIDDTVGRRPRCVLSVAQLSEAEREQLTAKGIPFVVFDPIDELPDHVPFVGATNWRGGQAATRHLVGLGHRRIAMISGPDHPFCLARLSGYSSALAEAGLPMEPDLIVKTQLTREHGYAAARQLLSRPDRPTAVFTANDMQALGVYQAARARPARPARSQRGGLRRRTGRRLDGSAPDHGPSASGRDGVGRHRTGPGARPRRGSAAGGTGDRDHPHRPGEHGSAQGGVTRPRVKEAVPWLPVGATRARGPVVQEVVPVTEPWDLVTW
ncbi:hypothetical protein GCM10022403_048440 [Streptomyces coacervatus]|uniref:HTH lacI-type domain-containing protein n=1 Tax=Streptomyces coacervatus TaxID=647381 RepID=A0ABP7I286_9ACTN